MENKNYINLTKEEHGKFIYRTLSFSRLVELFETEENTLSIPSKWDDPFENSILNSDFMLNGDRVRLDIRDRCFGQSWSRKYESDAMWRIYSPNKSCVRIRTTINKLAESLSCKCTHPETAAFIGKVEYHNKENFTANAKNLAEDILDGTGYNQARSLLFKRNAFKHEQEVRLIYFDYHRDTKKEFYQYEIEPHELIESVAVDPRASKQLVNVYKYYLRNEIGFKGSIIKSSLYDPPKGFIYELKR